MPSGNRRLNSSVNTRLGSPESARQQEGIQYAIGKPNLGPGIALPIDFLPMSNFDYDHNQFK